jgi:hypothetical protein
MEYTKNTSARHNFSAMNSSNKSQKSTSKKDNKILSLTLSILFRKLNSKIMKGRSKKYHIRIRSRRKKLQIRISGQIIME